MSGSLRASDAKPMVLMGVLSSCVRLFIKSRRIRSMRLLRAAPMTAVKKPQAMMASISPVKANCPSKLCSK